MINFFKNLFKKLFGSKKPIKKRRVLKDVESGESIRIEWHRIKGKIGFLKCINNDPETKKIFLEVTWGNHEEAGVPKKELLVLDYNSFELQNFSLLNPVPEDEDDEEENDDDFDIATLQKKLNKALDEEDYEVADKLQKKIDKLTQKPK